MRSRPCPPTGPGAPLCGRLRNGLDPIKITALKGSLEALMPAESRAFEYALGIFAVLIGLAVADIAASFHRLLRHKSQVRWDPLALLAASYALCTAVYMWFDIWAVRHFGATRHFFFYTGLVIELFILYLIAAASLPDETSGAVDLRQYYQQNRRHYWVLVALFQFGYVAFGVYFAGGEPAGRPLWVVVNEWVLMCAPLGIAVAMVALRSRTAHYLGLATLYLIMVLHYGGAAID